LKVLVIDNYDSFTFNLVQYIGELGCDPIVYRNDEIGIDDIIKINPASIVISPGPGSPKDAGISNEVISFFSGKVPILGVCLGHQCVAKVFGAKIVQAKNLMHGKTSFIYHDKSRIFKNIKNPFEATRYHSLIVKNSTIDKKILKVTAYTKEKEIMGIQHRSHKTYGVQFHPESILTNEGKKLLRNFLQIR